MMNPTAFIYGEHPHRELFVYEVPLWSFNDKDNVHEIENWKQMAEEIVATCGSLNNHLIYSQEDYPGIINDASGIEPVAKVSRIKYNEETKTFVADITSTNQQFIELIATTEYFPRVHPCYEAETNPRFVGYLTTVSSTFKRLLCWLVEPEKEKTGLSIEYRPVETETSDDKEEKASKLIPKEELMKIIFENVKGILENDLSYHKYPWACPDNSWSLSVYDDSFRYIIYDRQHCVSKSIGCNFDKDHWEIYIDEASNVNIVVYPDEALWMTDALLFRNPNKDFPKEVLENIIKDINAWIKTKDTPKEEHSAFSQALIKDGKRPSKIDYYLAMAEVASTRGTCLRRRYGSVIVKDDRIVSTGYAGAPSGRQNCCDIGYCFREANNIPAGAMYERCRSSHSEMNAIINASKEEMKDATLYLVGVEPDGKYTKANCCAICKKVIINSGISKVIARQSADEYIEIDVDDWKKNDDSLNSNHKGY